MSQEKLIDNFSTNSTTTPTIETTNSTNEITKSDCSDDSNNDVVTNLPSNQVNQNLMVLLKTLRFIYLFTYFPL